MFYHYLPYSEELFNSLRCSAKCSPDSLKLHINRRPGYYYAMSQQTKTAKQRFTPLRLIVCDVTSDVQLSLSFF